MVSEMASRHTAKLKAEMAGVEMQKMCIVCSIQFKCILRIKLLKRGKSVDFLLLI